VSKDKNKSNGFKSGKEDKTQSLPKRAVNIMQIGFYLHNNNPCSNEEDKKRMAYQTSITSEQVNDWISLKSSSGNMNETSRVDV